MITFATVGMNERDEVPDIDFDADDNGYLYIKQGSDWIAFPKRRLDQVIHALSFMGGDVISQPEQDGDAS